MVRKACLEFTWWRSASSVHTPFKIYSIICIIHLFVVQYTPYFLERKILRTFFYILYTPYVLKILLHSIYSFERILYTLYSLKNGTTFFLNPLYALFTYILCHFLDILFFGWIYYSIFNSKKLYGIFRIKKLYSPVSKENTHILHTIILIYSILQLRAVSILPYKLEYYVHLPRKKRVVCTHHTTKKSILHTQYYLLGYYFIRQDIWRKVCQYILHTPIIICMLENSILQAYMSILEVFKSIIFFTILCRKSRKDNVPTLPI